MQTCSCDSSSVVRISKAFWKRVFWMLISSCLVASCALLLGGLGLFGFKHRLKASNGRGVILSRACSFQTVLAVCVSEEIESSCGGLINSTISLFLDDWSSHAKCGWTHVYDIPHNSNEISWLNARGHVQGRLPHCQGLSGQLLYWQRWTTFPLCS